jgi:Zn-dependent peptidase ImmA (M78 family)
MSDGVVKTPEQILDELGITSPEDLDIEAIAYHYGATIYYEPLSGCEANIIGRKDRALITVNSNAIPTRRRFSAGHELGHWMRDRERIAFGCTQKDLDSQWTATEGSTNNPETRANQFAGDLLLPNRLFVPIGKGPTDYS